MAIQADIPPDLTNEDKAFVFQALDAYLNSNILLALLHGIYTGILAVTVWNIFINKRWPTRRALVVVIILLYALITVGVAADWSSTRPAFSENGQNFWTVFSELCSVHSAANLEAGIPPLMSTILADSYIIWCCWMIWEQRWLIVLLPILSLISAIVLILDLAFTIRHDLRWHYTDKIVGIVKGVAPTLLVGRAAAGHTRPTEEDDESSVVSTIRFQTSSLPSTSSFPESTMQSPAHEVDIEAQQERSDELVVVVERTQ
ncbi:hypothetical protein ARMGADRAFT_1165030 [Armillaria gallica]|uniref:Uncharacterized protein n=1 Tax=Armillaria gallica TaxID=47427 RepID=A0A2H3DI93_ARMGA|nr:hypothetical protein ARMGADRAFT_1165030 [Armillaria gallica]